MTKIGNPEFVFNNDEGIDSEQLAEGIRKVIGAEALELEHGKSYSSYEAGMICGKVFNNYSQRYDLVIVDEAQNIRNNNNATVFFNYWMGLKRFKPEACMDIIKMEKSAFVRHECKYLLLSATPAHRGVESLRKQLLYFEDSMNIGDISHDFLKKFMIRRLKTYNGKNKYAVRKIKADDVAKDLSATFKIGFLETFESYDV